MAKSMGEFRLAEAGAYSGIPTGEMAKNALLTLLNSTTAPFSPIHNYAPPIIFVRVTKTLLNAMYCFV